MNLSPIKENLSRINVSEKHLDIAAGVALGVIFLIGVSFQFGYSRSASGYQSLARPQSVTVAPTVDAEKATEDPDTFVPKTL